MSNSKCEKVPSIGDSNVRHVGIPGLVFGTRYELRVYRVRPFGSSGASMKPLVSSALDVPECLRLTENDLSLCGTWILFEHIHLKFGIHKNCFESYLYSECPSKTLLVIYNTVSYIQLPAYCVAPSRPHNVTLIGGQFCVNNSLHFRIGWHSPNYTLAAANHLGFEVRVVKGSEKVHQMIRFPDPVPYYYKYNTIYEYEYTHITVESTISKAFWVSVGLSACTGCRRELQFLERIHSVRHRPFSRRAQCK